MDDALAGLVVGVGEEYVPALWEGEGVNGKAVILRRDVTAFCTLVNARLVMTTVAIPRNKQTHKQS